MMKTYFSIRFFLKFISWLRRIVLKQFQSDSSSLERLYMISLAKLSRPNQWKVTLPKKIKSVIFKNFKSRFLEHELEFVAHIAPSCSTDQYFISSKYEVLTPSHHGDTKNQYFHFSPFIPEIQEFHEKSWTSSKSWIQLDPGDSKSLEHLRNGVSRPSRCGLKKIPSKNIDFSKVRAFRKKNDTFFCFFWAI